MDSPVQLQALQLLIRNRIGLEASTVGM